MIVVVGAVSARGVGADVAPGGLAAGIALTAAAAGARVEIVARIGDDPAGDAVLLAFTTAGVGHVATLRDPARATPIELDDDETMDPDPEDEATEVRDPAPAPTLDAADVGLALRYLSDYGVVVAVHPADAGVLAEVIAAAGYASAHLVVVTDPDVADTESPPADALVIAAAAGATGVADLLGRYAAAVDAGEDPATAFASVSAAASLGQG
ncbi:MAG: hypothetical protein ACSLFN_04580 [Candidatus Limnocylindrales bacterium]